MFFQCSKPVVEYIKPIDASQMGFCKSARLLYVNGSGALASATERLEEGYLHHLTLNGVPLLHINSPGWSTTESLLAAGHGVEAANIPQLRTVSERFNADFQDLDHSIEAITPLLSLLESGLYVVADTLCYPTDGNGNFFWNVPDRFTVQPATAMTWLHDEDFDSQYVGGDGVYLYPTQSTDCYCAERVEHYMARFRDSVAPPRAVAYHCGEFLSLLLDGHHKACAAALLGEALPCLVIVPMSYRSYREEQGKLRPVALSMGNLQIAVSDVPKKYLPPYKKVQIPDYAGSSPEEDYLGAIVRRRWEAKYLASAERYPQMYDYAVMRAAEVGELSDEAVQAALSAREGSGRRALRSILALLKVQKDPRLKAVALACAEIKEYCPLKIQAFRILCGLKGNTQVEQFFINWLIDDNDPHSLLGQLARSYWDDGAADDREEFL